ncbi:MAG: hypothetical protein Q8O53_00565 [Candidatus Moranbacteria bacterium]|nr:hypothetical protein [Candidatus Moranbacteria bacterium]
MSYLFKLQLQKESSRLSLLQDDQVIDDQSWPEARDMGQRLFAALAALLKKHDLKPEDVGEFQIESELPDTYTSSRIAETVKKVYAFGVALKQKER